MATNELPRPVFDPDQLGEKLVAIPVDRLHHAHGRGYRFSMGEYPETPQADLEIYPDSGLVRYTSEGSHIAFYAKDVAIEYTDQSVIFDAQTEHEHRTLVLNNLGEATYIISRPGLAPEDREVNGYLQAQDETVVPAADQPALWEQAEPPEANTETPQPNDNVQKSETEKQERVVLRGRVGKDPHIAQTARGTSIAKFPLAVHEQTEDGEKTSWHTVVAFNGLANEIADTVKKGQEYKVVGYHHEREDRGKTITEVYAASVKPPTKKKESTTE